jgi:hypothetical protein
MRYPPRRPRTSYFKEKQMGRPLKKDVRGTNVIRSFTGTQAGILVQGYFGGELQSDYQIVKQRGRSTYVVVRTDDDEFTDAESQGSLTGTDLKVGKLVVDEPAANGEIRIRGSVTGQTPGEVSIAKLTKRIATDFSGNRYTWFLDNDSSADVIVLTAV